MASIAILPIRSWMLRQLGQVMEPIVVKEGREIVIDVQWFGATYVTQYAFGSTQCVALSLALEKAQCKTE